MYLWVSTTRKKTNDVQYDFFRGQLTARRQPSGHSICILCYGLSDFCGHYRRLLLHLQQTIDTDLQ